MSLVGKKFIRIKNEIIKEIGAGFFWWRGISEWWKAKDGSTKKNLFHQSWSSLLSFRYLYVFLCIFGKQINWISHSRKLLKKLTIQFLESFRMLKAPSSFISWRLMSSMEYGWCFGNLTNVDRYFVVRILSSIDMK